jgi:dTMP kinase
MGTGFFISFEGGEGVGKTTQISRLVDTLEKAGHNVLRTREPGGTPHAEKLRNLLSDPELGPTWHPEAEAMIINAGRVMHVRDAIKPAMDAGQIVITDRFIDSTTVYQGHVQKLPMAFLQDLENTATDGLVPDLTLILDLPGEEGMKRVQARGARDHYDNQDIAFYEDIRQGFLEIARQNPERCVIIDAMQDINTIADSIKTVVLERL